MWNGPGITYSAIPSGIWNIASGTMNACKTLPEYEIFDYGQLNNLKNIKKQGLSRSPCIFSLCQVYREECLPIMKR